MVDLSIHPNWARSSSSQRSMGYTIIIFGKPHEYSGPTTVYGLGIVAGSYDWNDHFGDIDGWDIQHLRRINWFWKRGESDAPPSFDTPPLSPLHDPAPDQLPRVR